MLELGLKRPKSGSAPYLTAIPKFSDDDLRSFELGARGVTFHLRSKFTYRDIPDAPDLAWVCEVPYAMLNTSPAQLAKSPASAKAP